MPNNHFYSCCLLVAADMRQIITEALQENSSGRGSSKRLTLVVASFSMSLSLVILSIAALMGKDVAAALLAVAGPLGAMSGYGYVHKPEGGK